MSLKYLKELSKYELFLDNIFIKNKTARQIIISAYNKLKRQQKEIEELNTELEIRIKWQQYFEKEYISKDKIREKIKELEDNMILFTNDKEKFNRYKYARNILEELLEEN